MSKKRTLAHGKPRGGKHAGPPSKKQRRGLGSSSSSGPAGTTTSCSATTRPSQKQAAQPKKNNNNDSSTQSQHLVPTIPFAPHERILLVGEGDLSFATSLVRHHGCTRLTATVLEGSRQELLAKYPHAGDNVDAVEAVDGCRVLFGVDARKLGPLGKRKRPRHRERKKGTEDEGTGKEAADYEWEEGHGISEDEQLQDGQEQEQDHQNASSVQQPNDVSTCDRILFNFPHVGGKSTDVNRQVRYNQELLVDFFRRATALLAPAGTIVVTLFEGEPYTLWNVRDLARHAGGLRVDRSFRFQADAYPGYEHARTMGVVRARAGKDHVDGRGGGWKGNERLARSYVFARKEEDVVQEPGTGANGVVVGKRRRRGGQEDSDDTDDD